MPFKRYVLGNTKKLKVFQKIPTWSLRRVRLNIPLGLGKVLGQRGHLRGPVIPRCEDPSSPFGDGRLRVGGRNYEAVALGYHPICPARV